MGIKTTLVSERIDIDMVEHPSSISSHDAGTTLSIGDLHGNAIKLIYILIREGVIALQNGELDYHELMRIYEKLPPGKYHDAADENLLTRNDLDNFKSILSHAEIISPDIKINLIGDELADRGRNDYFMLLVLKQLQERKIETDIFISNHAAEFIKAYASMESKNEPCNQLKNSIMQTDEGSEHCKEAVTFKDVIISGYEQTNSLQNLGFIMTAGLVTKEELTFLVKDAYVPNIKLLDYSFDDMAAEFYIYSHNMIGLETVAKLAAEYNIELWIDELLQCKTARDMAECLMPVFDAINNAFRASILHQCADGKNDFNVNVAEVLDSNVIQRVTWERKIPAGIMLGKIGPIIFKSVHGHQGPDFVSHTLFNVNLDTHLGREDNPDGSYFGEYCIMSAPTFLRAALLAEEAPGLPRLDQDAEPPASENLARSGRHRRHAHYFGLPELPPALPSEHSYPPLPVLPRKSKGK